MVQNLKGLTMINPGFQPRDKAIKYKTVREELMIEIVKKNCGRNGEVSILNTKSWPTNMKIRE